MSTFRFSGAVLAAALLAAPALAPAQSPAEFPTRTVTLIVPFPAGGITDTIARTVAQEMQKGLGQTVIVDNRPGAGGQLAANGVKQASADGHTLFVGATEMFAINQNLYRNFSYDPLTDFRSVAPLLSSPLVLIVPAGSPPQTVQELVDRAKASPDGVSYASQGMGSIGHLLGELFRQETGATTNHVPYRGSAPALQDLAGGQVDMMFDPVLTASPLVQGGKLRALAIAAAKPAPAMPEVRPLAEFGLPAVDASVWFGVAARAGTPDAVIERLNAEINKALANPELLARFTDQGLEPMPMSPQEFDAFLRAEVERWTPLVKASGVTVD